MADLLVIADDLTGALDTAVKFSSAGNTTFVMPECTNTIAPHAPNVSVLAVNTNSRHDSPKIAFEKVFQIAKEAKELGIHCIYKKVDATLRGNIGAELSAISNAYPGEPLAFLPAFPAMGRTTKEGICYVDGVSLEKTHFAADPFTPVNSGDIGKVIAEQTRQPIIKAGAAKDFSLQFDKNLAPIIIFDAETDADVAETVKALAREKMLSLTAGCSAFAGEISKYMSGNLPMCRMPDDVEAPRLIICGSVNETTLRQIRYAVDHLQYTAVTLSPQQKLDAITVLKDGAFVDLCTKVLHNRGKLIIQSADSADDMRKTDTYFAETGMPIEKIHLHIAEQMGKLAAAIIQAAQLETTVVFGGDTLVGIMKAIGAKGLFPYSEIIPGTVCSLVRRSGASSLNIVTKSGALGGENVLETIEKFFIKREKHEN